MRTNSSRDTPQEDRSAIWALKLDNLIVAKSRKNYLPNWLRRLYKEIDGFHYDCSVEEVKKYVGTFMRNGFSKKKLPIEELKFKNYYHGARMRSKMC